MEAAIVFSSENCPLFEWTASREKK